jgi:molybdopterin molybdotransferase
VTRQDIGYPEALSIVESTVRPAAPSPVPVWEAAGAVLARDVVARVDSPSVSSSSRDGFAVRAADVARASDQGPASLRLVGSAVAGTAAASAVAAGTCVEVTTGAPLPAGADAVVSSELCLRRDDTVEVRCATDAGRNVVPRGADVRAGALIASAGTRITPAMAGQLAAGGLHEVDVHPLPRVALVATGDEVVAPGRPIRSGQLYASNVVTLQAWLQSFSMRAHATVAPDDDERLGDAFETALAGAGALLTSGGAWMSRRDRTVDVLRSLGFEFLFHRVRLAPGKAVAFGVRGHQIAFCLPGGPPSNEMAFLQLALPGLLRRGGRRGPVFEVVKAVLRCAVRKQRDDPSWTNFYQADLVERDGGREVVPAARASRLEALATANSLIVLPEGALEARPGDVVEVQRLWPR